MLPPAGTRLYALRSSFLKASTARRREANCRRSDDTPITVLDRGGGSFKGRIWTYLDPLSRQVVFEATATHERAGPEAFLATFTGHLQADAYTGYDALYRSGRIVEVGCWAHARRRFVEALDTDVSAAPVLARIQQLYQVEHDAADLAPGARRDLRQARAVSLLAQFETQRRALATQVLPKLPIGEALRYLDRQWVALQRYVTDGRLLIDNDNAERQLRTVAVGRKNWLFAGSLEGARRVALLAAPKLSADWGAAVPVPARRLATDRHASAHPDSPTHAEGLTRDLRRLTPPTAHGARRPSSTHFTGRIPIGKRLDGRLVAHEDLTDGGRRTTVLQVVGKRLINVGQQFERSVTPRSATSAEMPYPARERATVTATRGEAPRTRTG